MAHGLRPRASITGNGVITYARPTVFGGMTLLRGERFTGHYRAHLHTTYVVGVVEAGALGLITGGHTHVLTAGDILLLNPLEVHEEFSLGPSGWSFRYFFPGTAALGSLLTGRGGGAPTPWFAAPVARDERMARRLIRLHESLLLDGGPALPAVEAELAEVLRKLVRAGTVGRRPVGGLLPQMLRVRDHILGATADSLRLESLAKVGRLSPYHLVRMFHREIGLPPHAYFEQLRIARCKELLHDRRRLSEVAFLMRYSDQSHFTRQFGDTAGVSPGKYADMVGAPGQRLSLPVRRTRPAQFHSISPEPPR